MEITGSGNFPKKSPLRKHTEDDSALDEDEMRDTIVVFENLNISKTERNSNFALEDPEDQNAPKKQVPHPSEAWKVPASLLIEPSKESIKAKNEEKIS
jgi:hypothetical protein